MAAGNNGNFLGTGENCIYPARWASVIATGATTASDTRAYYSSTCPEVELAAPGDAIYSTLPGGGYGTKSGTSMASPHAAGAAALILAANPGWSNEQVRTRLQVTADDLGTTGRDPWYGFGLVDADQAALPSNNPPVASDQAVTTAEDTPIDILLTASDADGDPLTYHVVAGPAHGTLSGTAPHLTYSPFTATSGADSFTFLANDGQADSNIATVSITIEPASPADTVTILKATYTSRKQKLELEATSSAGKEVTLTATAFNAAGGSLGSIQMEYSARRNKFTGTISGLAVKPYRVVVISSGGGSASVEGDAIGGR